MSRVALTTSATTSCRSSLAEADTTVGTWGLFVIGRGRLAVRLGDEPRLDQPAADPVARRLAAQQCRPRRCPDGAGRPGPRRRLLARHAAGRRPALVLAREGIVIAVIVDRCVVFYWKNSIGEGYPVREAHSTAPGSRPGPYPFPS